MVIALAMLVLAASAAEPLSEPLSEPLAVSFDEALALAESAPGPLGAARALEVRRSKELQPSVLSSNPQLLVEPGYSQLDQARGPDFRFGLTQSFNLGGQPAARKAGVQAEQAVLGAEARGRLLERRLSVADAWFELWAAEHVLAHADEELTLAKSFRQAVEGAVTLGAATRLESAEAAAYLADIRLLALSAEGDRNERWLALAQLVDHAPSRPLQAAGALPEVQAPAPSTQEALLAQASRLPEPLALSLGARADRARAEEARAAQGLQLNLGVAGRREFDGTVGGSLTAFFTLPLFEHGQRERGTYLANAARQEGEARDAASRAAAALALAFHEVEHSREVLETLRDELVPAADEAARMRELLFQAGDTTVLEVVRARLSLAAARIQLARARADEARARVRARFLADALSGVPSP